MNQKKMRWTNIYTSHQEEGGKVFLGKLFRKYIPIDEAKKKKNGPCFCMQDSNFDISSKTSNSFDSLSHTNVAMFICER